MSFVRQSANPIFVLGFFSEKYESHICLGVFRKCANPILFMSFFSAKCESHFFWIFRKSANRIFVYEFFGNVRIPYSDLGSARLCSFAVNWESDLQCRRGPNAVQNTLKPTSHSYPRKTTRGPSPCLQSINKPTTTLHVTIRGPTDNGFRMPTAY